MSVTHLVSVLILFLHFSIPAGTAFASEQPQIAPDLSLDGVNNETRSESNGISTATGMIMLDYEVIPVSGDKPIDLLGIHYLQQLNSWLYMGLGFHGPLVEGNYGGTMAFDATIHAQHRLIGNSFIDAGASFGGGGGGASISKSKELSGSAAVIKGYLGIGYDFPSFSAGINYAHFEFVSSQLNHSQLNLFFQKPVSFPVAAYAYTGNTAESYDAFSENGENNITLELNNIFQVKPKGKIKKTINSLSLQFSHFNTENSYVFFGVEAGYYGIPLYNQILGGFGYKHSISPRLNIYGQLGVGSGGYAESVIETGPGLLVYPKFSAEYLMDKNLGLSLSTGYLFAPKGSSTNYTLGAAMNYHLSTEEKNYAEDSTTGNMVYRGFRFNLFQQTQFDVTVGGKKHDNINMLSIQLDHVWNENWYLPFQVNAAYSRFEGYPGYAELFTGLGIQNTYSQTDSFQSFFQILIGSNVNNILLKPTIGFHYSLSDHLALNGQLAKIISLNEYTVTQAPKNLRLNSSSVGLGLTYRFSIPSM